MHEHKPWDVYMRALVRNIVTMHCTTLDGRQTPTKLSLGILFLKPPPSPQNNLSPRRSPAVGRELDEPGVPHTEFEQTEQEGMFPFQNGVNGVLRCTGIPQQEENLPSQAGVWAKL